MKKWSPLVAAGLLALGVNAAIAADAPKTENDNNTVYFYNWTEYVPPGLLEGDLFHLRVQRNYVCQAEDL